MAGGMTRCAPPRSRLAGYIACTIAEVGAGTQQLTIVPSMPSGAHAIANLPLLLAGAQRYDFPD